MANSTTLTPWQGSTGSLVVDIPDPADAQDPYDTPFPVEEERFDEVDFSFEPIKLTEGQVDKTFSRWGSITPSVLAATIVDDIRSQPGNEDLLNIDSLRDGTAPYFDLNPQTRDLLPFERALTYNEISRTFSNLRDQSFLDRLKVESPNAASFLAGAYTGGRLGALGSRAVAGVPVVGPYAAAGLPVVTTVLGGIVGQDFFQRIGLAEKLEGEAGYLPSSRSNVVLGRATREALEGAGGLAALALTIGKKGKANLGSDAVVMLKGLQDQVNGPQGPFYKRLLRGLESAGINLQKGTENILGSVAASARQAPKRAAAAETIIGGLSVAGARTGEAISPGSEGMATTGQILLPTTAAAFYTLSPLRFVLGSAIKGYQKGKQMSGQMKEEAVSNFNLAREDNPDARPEDFGLKIGAGNQLELIEQPGFGQKLKFGLGAYKDKRKQAAADVVLRQFVKDLEDRAVGDDEIEESVDKLIKSFEAGDTSPLYNEPALVQIRRMLDRMGADFSQQEGVAKGKLQEEVEAAVSLIATGLASGDENGYRFASVLAQNIYEAGIARDLSDRAARVFNAQRQLSNEPGIDAETAAKNLSKAVNPLIDATKATAEKLYSDIPSHRILFEADNPPLILNALDEVPELRIALDDPAVKKALPSEVSGALDQLVSIRNKFDDFVQAGTGGTGAAVVADLPEQTKLLGLRDKLAGEDSLTSVDDILSGRKELSRPASVGDSGPSFTKLTLQRDDNGQLEVTQENVDTLGQIISQREKNKPRGSATTTHRQAQDVLRAEKNLLSARLEQAAQPAQAAQTLPDSIESDALKVIRTTLLDFARGKNTPANQARIANAIAEYYTKQQFDPDAARDIEDVSFITKRAAANAYYKARQNIFNGGLFAEIAKKSPQGIDQSVENLQAAMNDLSVPAMARIKDLQRAVRFTFDPVDAPSLPETALLRQTDVDRGPYKEIILDNIVMPVDEIPPSIDAAETAILSKLNDTLVAARRVGGTKKDVLDPQDAEQGQILDRPSDFGMSTGERNAIQSYLDDSANNGLDLLPGLKQRLQILLNEGVSYRDFVEQTTSATKKFKKQNLWTVFSSAGENADFSATLKKAFGQDLSGQIGARGVFDNLLNPIKVMDQKAQEDPRAFLKALQDNRLFDALEARNIDNLSDTEVDDLVKGAKTSAREGLKSLIVDFAKSSAGRGSKGGINYNKFKEILFEGKVGNERMPSLVEWMSNNGLMTRPQRDSLRKSLDQLGAFDSEVLGLIQDDITNTTNPILRATISTFGAALGSGLYRFINKATGGLLGGSGQLVASGSGAGAAREVLLNARAGAVMDGMFTLMQDRPFEIARLLKIARKGANPQARVTEGDLQSFSEILRRLQGASLPKIGVVKAGGPAETEQQPLMGTPELRKRLDPYNLEGEERSSVTPALRSQDVAQFQLPSQQAGFLPQLTQAAQAGAPASRPTGQANPQQRQGLAALFPNDPILGANRG